MGESQGGKGSSPRVIGLGVVLAAGLAGGLAWFLRGDGSPPLDAARPDAARPRDALRYEPVAAPGRDGGRSPALRPTTLPGTLPALFDQAHDALVRALRPCYHPDFRGEVEFVFQLEQRGGQARAAAFQMTADRVGRPWFYECVSQKVSAARWPIRPADAKLLATPKVVSERITLQELSPSR